MDDLDLDLLQALALSGDPRAYAAWQDALDAWLQLIQQTAAPDQHTSPPVPAAA